MDPLSVIASSLALLQTVAATYRKIHDIRGLPKAFDRVNESLGLVELTLVKARDGLHGQNGDLIDEAIAPLTRRCEKKIRILCDIFNEVDGSKGVQWQGRTWNTAVQNYRAILLKLGTGNKVEALMQEILADLASLGQYQLFGLATQTQVAQLQNDIKKLSKVEPSLADSDLSSTTQHIAEGGTGHQYINYGANQQPNTGSGHQYNAQTMHFGIRPIVNPDRENRTSVMRSLQTTPYKDNKNRNPVPVSGTCEWFLGHKLFRQWSESPNSTILWVSADPGSGKSVLAKHLVDTILPREHQSSTVCYFFFKDDDDSQRSAKSALRCMLHQVFTQKEELLSDKLVNRFEEGGGHDTSSLQNIWDIFVFALSQESLEKGRRTVVCVLDALDECSSTEQDQLMKLMCDLYRGTVTLGTLRLKMLVTSRPTSTVRKGLHPLQRYGMSLIHLSGEDDTEVEKIKREIDLVIKANVDDLQSLLLLDDNEKEMVLLGLQKFENRTYLWVHLTLDVIERQFNEKMDLATISNNLPPSVDAAYERMLSTSPDKEKAKRLLHIILAAVGPLTVKEMNFALAIQPYHKAYTDVRTVPDIRFREYVRELCGLLVTIVDSKVYLLHQTAREFLTRAKAVERNSHSLTLDPAILWKSSLRPQESHRVITNICVWQLSFADIKEPIATEQNLGYYYHFLHRSVLERTSRFQENSLLTYSALNWIKHFVASGPEADPDAAISLVCMNEHARGYPPMWFEIFFYDLEGVYPVGFTSLMVACYCGLDQVVKHLLENSRVDVNAKDYSGRSALSWQSTKRLSGSLLGNVNSMLVPTWYRRGPPLDNGSWNMVQEEAEARYATIVNLLLNAGADADVADHCGLTPLHYATVIGSKHIAQTLLTAGANLHKDSPIVKTPLQLAVQFHKADLVKLFAIAGADVNVANGYKETMLSQLVMDLYQSPRTMPSMVDIATDIEIDSYRTLTDADIEIFETLVEGGSGVNKRTEFGDTLLTFAIRVDFPPKLYRSCLMQGQTSMRRMDPAARQ